MLKIETEHLINGTFFLQTHKHTHNSTHVNNSTVFLLYMFEHTQLYYLLQYLVVKVYFHYVFYIMEQKLINTLIQDYFTVKSRKL